MKFVDIFNALGLEVLWEVRQIFGQQVLIVIWKKEWLTAVWHIYTCQWLQNLSYIETEFKKKLTWKLFILGCDTYKLDYIYGSEITEGDWDGIASKR